MSKMLCQWILAVTMSLLAFSTFAIDIEALSRDIPALHSEEPARSTLIGIFESCGNASNLNDNCVLQNLGRVAREEENTTAQAIYDSYFKTFELGTTEFPECQTQTHLQANRVLGHCLLLLNFYTLQGGDQEESVNKFETCFQGGMLGLAHSDNIVAQY